MYEGGLKSGAHKIITFLFIVCAIVAIVAGCKVVLDHIDSDGTVTSSKDECVNEEGMETLEKAGVYGNAKPRCKNKK